MFQVARASISGAIRICCGVHFIHSHVYELSESHGYSMVPTINMRDDWLHVNKLVRRGRDCQVGDIIIAVKPTDPEQRICKRITGMPGDVILVDPSGGDYDRFITVPEGHCWVTGDNLNESLDSRSYGVIPLALIKGRVFATSQVDGWKFWQWESKWIENGLE